MPATKKKKTSTRRIVKAKDIQPEESTTIEKSLPGVAAVEKPLIKQAVSELNGIFTKEETQDAYEITEWFASQPWCDGNIGMLGGSYLGITQLMAASTKPPHLRALFPIVALYDTCVKRARV